MPKNVKSSCFDSIQRFLRAAAARIGFRPSSRGNRAVLRSASGVIPCLLRPSARSPHLPTIFPFDIFLFERILLLDKIVFSLAASFPPRTWIGFLWLLFCLNAFFFYDCALFCNNAHFCGNSTLNQAFTHSLARPQTANL